MPDKGTVVPLPPSAERLAAADSLAKPQNFVPATSVSAGEWAACADVEERFSVKSKLGAW